MAPCKDQGFSRITPFRVRASPVGNMTTLSTTTFATLYPGAPNIIFAYVRAQSRYYLHAWSLRVRVSLLRDEGLPSITLIRDQEFSRIFPSKSEIQYVYTYIYTYTYTYMYSFIFYMYMYIHIFICMYIHHGYYTLCCIHTYIYIYMYDLLPIISCISPLRTQGFSLITPAMIQGQSSGFQSQGSRFIVWNSC